MVEPVDEQGQKENRQEDCQQDLLRNCLDAFRVHGAMPQE
jgi:hypothetical protein